MAPARKIPECITAAGLTRRLNEMAYSEAMTVNDVTIRRWARQGKLTPYVYVLEGSRKQPLFLNSEGTIRKARDLIRLKWKRPGAEAYSIPP